MNKSLPAIRFFCKLSIHPPVIIIILFLLLNNSVINAQDVLHSVGQAPISEMKVVPEENFPFAVGTRAFVKISASTNFQFGKSFMESCAITNIGAASPLSGGLVYRNGVVYTWNPVSPFQLWRVDTAAGVHTLIFNMTGIPLANLTGMCWDGTNMYGVATNFSSSQLFSLNMATGTSTLIGTPSAVCAGAVNLFGRMFAGSSLYSVDMVNDNFYRWNKTTGVAVLFGPVGFNTDAGQGASFDGNTCYWTVNSQLRRWDTTGSNILLCTYAANVIAIACVSSQPPIFPWPMQTYCRNGRNISVPDNGSVRDTIFSSLCSWGVVLDVNVVIDTFVHTWDSDMQFSLIHNSTTAALITNRGGSGDNFMGTVLDDSAANPISSGTPPFTGSYRPEQPLNVYNNQPPSGNWYLLMADVAGGDTGFLRAWCLKIVYNCADGGIQTVEIPFTYRLYQNYPNPFNPVTTIKYGLPKFGKTRLVVYDILGKVVTTLVDNEFKDAGTYEVGWDASDFSSGIYFYTLESGNFKETKKMVLIK